MDPRSQTTEFNARRIDELVEEFVDRIRRGESISIDEFAENRPEVASQLRELLPVLVALENCAPASGEVATLPKRIGEYQIQDLLGRGGMGIVYRAVQPSLDRQVALKVLLQAHLASPQTRARFLREGKSVAKLKHDHIVPIFEIGSHNGVDYLAMQLVQGSTLQSLIETLRAHQSTESTSTCDRHGSTISIAANAPSTDVRSANNSNRVVSIGSTNASNPPGSSIPGPVSRPDVLRPFSPEHWSFTARVGRAVADGLRHAHDEGVLHRDVKPSNVMIDRDGKTWVTDFGLAKTADSDLTRTGVAVGTLRYMAPEQLFGEPTAKSDIYGFGVMLSELLTLERPEEISVARVPRFSTSSWNPVPASMKAIALRCTAPYQPSRYRSFAEVVADLDRFLSGQTVAVRPPGRLEKIWWSIQNRQALCAACLMVLLLVFAFTSYVTVQNAGVPTVVHGIDLYGGGEDREIAEWVLDRGTVTVLNGDGLSFVDPSSTEDAARRELPDGRFNLRAIHLWECNDLDEAMFRRFVNLPRLHILHLDHCHFEEAWVKHLTNAAEIEYLNLYGCHLTDSAMVPIAKMNLTYLGLTDNDISDEGVSLLRPTGLTELKLANNSRITDQVFESLQKITKFEFLDVTGTSVTEGAAREFERKMKSRVGPYAIVAGPSDMHSVVINGYEIYTHGPDRKIATWVLNQGGGVWIVSEHGPQMIERGHDEPIVENELPDSPFHIKDIVLNNIQTLNEDIIRQFPNIPRLETLVLSGSNFDRSWVRYLAQCERLRYLNLGSCGITDADMHKLSTISASYLGLNYNELTDQGIAKLVNNKELSEITLAANTEITDAVFDSLRQIPALELVDVAGTGVTEEVAAQFEERLQRIGVVTNPKIVRGKIAP